MAKIKFISITNPKTSFERKVNGEISSINTEGNYLSNPPTIDEAKNIMQSILQSYYKLDKKYWSHRPLTVSVDQDGVWLIKVKFTTLIGQKICGFIPVQKDNTTIKTI